MLSLLRQRIVSRLGVSSTLSLVRTRVATRPGVLSARRSFLTSIPQYLAASSKKTTETITENTAAKKTSAAKGKAAKAKPKTVGKKVVEKSNVVKTKTSTRPVLSKLDMPPKAPHNPYIIFYTKYLHGLSNEHKPKSLADTGSLAKDASSMWQSFTDAEKKPFYDDFAVARAQYIIAREAYFANVPISTLAEINKRRRAKGLPKIHANVSAEDRRPLSSFFKFMADFRTEPAAQECMAANPGRSGLVLVAKLGGEKWRSMSDVEKAPYKEGTQEEMAKYVAKHRTTV